MKYKNYSAEIWGQIEQALVEELKTNPHPVAAFDADGTLWDTDLGEQFFRYEIANKLLANLPADPWRHYRDWKETSDPRPAYWWLAQIHKGQRLGTVQTWAEQAVKAREPLPIFEAQQTLISKLVSSGVEVWIVTASVKWAVDPGASRLGLSQQQVIGVETDLEGDIITDKTSGIMTYRQGKVEALLAKTKGRKPFLSSGNTIGDLSLLESATRIRLAVGASTEGHEMFEAEEKLRAEARARNWIIHQF